MKTLLKYSIVLVVLIYASYFIEINNKKQSNKVDEDVVVNETNDSQDVEQQPITNNIPTNTISNNRDPLSLSFNTSSYLEEAIVLGKLSNSILEYCSSIENNGKSTLYSWKLKSNNKEVYACSFTYDKNRIYNQQSKAICQKKEGYDDYLAGDTKLIRYYVMPEADDDIDMFVYRNSSSYYDKYFILGKYSDMKCHISGGDIYFEYYWYQNTDNGPVLVYYSTATNNKTTYGRRYNTYLWDLFEKSYKNIDIIQYDEYPRFYDYYEVYRKWESEERERRVNDNLNEDIETYCNFTDGYELYSEYEAEFDSYDVAQDFYDTYCN